MQQDGISYKGKSLDAQGPHNPLVAGSISAGLRKEGHCTRSCAVIPKNHNPQARGCKSLFVEIANKGNASFSQLRTYPSMICFFVLSAGMSPYGTGCDCKCERNSRVRSRR